MSQKSLLDNYSFVTNFFLWWSIIFFEFLPYVVIIFCFASMLHFVYKHDRSTRKLAKQLRFNHQVQLRTHKKSAIILMAIVIGLFLFTYALYLRCSFVILLNGDQIPCNDFEYKIPISVLNSAVNPLAYAFFKRDIKKEFKRLLCIWIIKKENKVNPFAVHNSNL